MEGAPEEIPRVVVHGGLGELPEWEGFGQRQRWLDCGFDAARHDQTETVCLAHREHLNIAPPSHFQNLSAASSVPKASDRLKKQFLATD